MRFRIAKRYMAILRFGFESQNAYIVILRRGFESQTASIAHGLRGFVSHVFLIRFYPSEMQMYSFRVRDELRNIYICPCLTRRLIENSIYEVVD